MAETERKSLQGMYAKEEGVLAEFMDHMYRERMATRHTAYNYYMMITPLPLLSWLIRAIDSL